jgi:hypothetical protein
MQSSSMYCNEFKQLTKAVIVDESSNPHLVDIRVNI